MAAWEFRRTATADFFSNASRSYCMLDRMERPAYLREDLYRLIIEKLDKLGADESVRILSDCGYSVPNDPTDAQLLACVLERPASFLAHAGILHRADLLTDLFIEFDDGELDEGHTYRVDAEAAEEIAQDEPTILLRDGRSAVMVPRTRIERAFKNGCLIDYYAGASP